MARRDQQSGETSGEVKVVHSSCHVVEAGPVITTNLQKKLGDVVHFIIDDDPTRRDVTVLSDFTPGVHGWHLLTFSARARGHEDGGGVHASRHDDPRADDFSRFTEWRKTQ